MNTLRQQEGFQKLQNAFLLLASHEIKTPLTAILGYSELLLRRKDKISQNAHYQSWLTHIHVEGLRLSEYVQKLLAQDSGEIAYDFDFIDMEVFLKESFQLRSTQIHVSSDSLFKIFASKKSLKLAFQKLLKLMNTPRKQIISINLTSRNSYLNIELKSKPAFQIPHGFDHEFEEVRQELFRQYGLLNSRTDNNGYSLQIKFPKIKLEN